MSPKKSKPRPYYPIFLNLRGKKCVVVGGGAVALRKVKTLLACGADITVISPNPHSELRKLFKDKAIRLFRRHYKRGDLKNSIISIATTDVKGINRLVAQEAKGKGILVNVVDDVEPSDFIIPSSFRRGNLSVAVSTSGKSPALAKKIRAELEKNIGMEYAYLLSLISKVRSEIKQKGLQVSAKAWQAALDLDSLILVLKAGQHEDAKAALLGKLNPMKAKNKHP
jgi:precorrin-2 dehydrogenase/sirohydrochlorin ferrochelatase